MIKFIFISIFTLFLFFTKISLAETTFRCSNVKGIDLNYSNKGIESIEDGYSQTTFVLTIESSASNASIYWEGGLNSGFSEKLIGVNGSDDGWLTWVSAWPQVTRLYTLFIDENTYLSLVETQSQMLTNNPQVRSFFGTCK